VQAQDEFLASVPHELRSPLDAILGWVHLLKTGELDPERARRALETIERNARSQSRATPWSAVIQIGCSR
jgi:signal transduction histidine kinase